MKNNSVLKYCVQVGAILSFAVPTFAAPWVDLSTDQKKLSYGLWIRHEMPEFFRGTFNYGMQFWKVTEVQEELRHKLHGLYPQEMDHQPLATLSLNRFAEKSVMSPQTFESWKGRVELYLSSLPNQTTHQNLVDRMAEHLVALQEIDPGELLSSLMTVAVKNPKTDGHLFRISNEEKFEYLKQNLPEDLTGTRLFSNPKVKFPKDKVGTRESALSTLSQLQQGQRELELLIPAIVMAKSLPASSDISLVQHSVQAFDHAQVVELYTDDSAQNVIVQSLEQLLGRSQEDAMKLGRVAGAQVTKELQVMSKAGDHKIKVAVPYLQLVEEPRELAIFSSVKAQDCRHTCSFSRSDSPYDKMFFVHDPVRNKDLGYIETSIVQSERGPILFVDTINGQTITPEQAEELLFLLFDNRQALKVREIGIITQDLHLHMNYEGVISYLDRRIEPLPKMHVAPTDSKVQDLVEHYLEVEYPKARNNTTAAIYSPLSELKHNFSTTTVFHQESTLPFRAIDKKEALLFALELDSTFRWLPQPGQPTDGERAALAAGLSLSDYHAVRSIFGNTSRKAYADYLKDVKHAMSSHGIAVDSEFINDRPYLFYDGQLRASDCLQGTLRNSTLKIATQMIKRGMWHSTSGLIDFGHVPENADAINQSRELGSVIAWAESDVAFHSIQLRNMVSAGIGFPQMREPKMVREFLRIIAHGYAWGPDLSLQILKSIFPNLSESVLPHYLHDEDPAVREGVEKVLKVERETNPNFLPLKPEPILEAIKGLHSGSGHTCGDLLGAS